MPEPLPIAESSRQPSPEIAIRMEDITKRFPGVTANQNVSLSVQSGTFHAIIGENGAGKSTLLNVLYGRYRPDEGRVVVRGADVTDILRSPSDAIGLGLGLVSQHYALIPALTVLENIVLGSEPMKTGGILDRQQARERIDSLADKLGMGRFNLDARAERLSVAAGQKVEILKALYRGAQILLLDEPTATLAPQEAESLFALLQTLLGNGTTIVFVTHKLREVMQYSQAVTVLRAGHNAGEFLTSQTNPDELLLHMIGPRGKGALSSDTQGAKSKPEIGEAPIEKPSSGFLPPLLGLVEVSVRNARGGLAVRSADLSVGEGEIVGIAGVDGSGQRELAEALVGLRSVVQGQIRMRPGKSSEMETLNRKTVRERQRMGVAYIPEDRHQSGLALDFSISENYLLGHEKESNWGGGLLLQTKKIFERAQTMVRSYDVRMGERDVRSPARTLSGGNQQKVVIARAMDSDPCLLIACQPTRGLDVEAARFVYETLQRARARGVGILLFSLDLDEILELSDRIAVMFNGEIVGVLSRSEATPEKVGALMTGSAIQKPGQPPAEGPEQ